MGLPQSFIHFFGVKHILFPFLSRHVADCHWINVKETIVIPSFVYHTVLSHLKILLHHIITIVAERITFSSEQTGHKFKLNPLRMPTGRILQ